MQNERSESLQPARAQRVAGGDVVHFRFNVQDVAMQNERSESLQPARAQRVAGGDVIHFRFNV